MLILFDSHIKQKRIGIKWQDGRESLLDLWEKFGEDRKIQLERKSHVQERWESVHISEYNWG